MTRALGTSYDDATSSQLLDAIAGHDRARLAAEVEQWRAIVAWAENNLHSGPDERHVDDVVSALDAGVQLAGAGTPPVSEFAVHELIAVLGRSPESGRILVSKILEVAWRLPQVWAAVVAGRLAPWRAGAIAERTIGLNHDAAAFIDSQLFNAHRVGWAQLQRLVDEAITRHDPERAREERDQQTAQLGVHLSEPTPTGIVLLDAVLDAADAKDANSAIARRAELRARLGDTGTIDQRRARGLGDLARADLELDLLADDADGHPVRMPARRAEVVVHITPDTLTGDNPVARWNQRPVAAE